MQRIFTVILLFVAALWSFSVKAQVNNSVIFGEHFSTQAANSQPASLGEDINNFEISLFNTYGWFSNTAINWGQIKEIRDAEVIDEELVDKTLDQLEANNHVSTGANISPFSFAYKIKNDGEELLTFSMGFHLRMLGNFQYSKTFLDVLWNGNRKYKGEEINLGPFKLNALPVKEYSLGIAAPLPVEFGGIKLRPGIRLRYLQGIGSFYTERGDMLMYTQNDARRIRLTANYEFNRSGDFVDDFDPMANRGTGIGMDIGVKAEINKNFDVSLSVADIGSIKFTRDVKNFQKHETYYFDGINVDVIKTFENKDIEINPDSIENILQPEESTNSYKMPLGTRLILQGEYKFGEFEKNDKTYFNHHLFLLYQQGFKHHLKATERPYVAAGYTYSLNNIFNVGASASAGGYNQFTFGPYLSLKAGFFKIGVGSNNVLPLIAEDFGTGVDASFNMALSF